MDRDFDAVIDANERRLRFIARRYGGRDCEQDVYQEMVLQLWRSFEGFRGDADRATWLYRVALNTALMWRRKEARQPVVSAVDAMPEPAEPQGQSELAILEDFVATLNDVDSMTLMMHLDDVAAADIAQVLGISANAVHIRLNRLKQKFNDRYVD